MALGDVYVNASQLPAGIDCGAKVSFTIVALLAL